LELNPEITQALYKRSWTLAIYEGEKYRNGEEAVKLAEKLSKITQYRQLLTLDVLVPVYAEKGKCATAVLTNQKWLEMVELQGHKELALVIKKRLDFYRTRQPYRQNLNNKNES